MSVWGDNSKDVYARSFGSDFDLTSKYSPKYKPSARTDNSVLINVNSILLSEKMDSISYIPSEYREYITVDYGRPDESKTFVKNVFNNETNTAFEVTFAFENTMPNPDAFSVSAVTDPRYLSVTGRHIFIKMPDDRFEPRINDHRIGYFVNKSTDLTSYDNFPNFALIAMEFLSYSSEYSYFNYYFF